MIQKREFWMVLLLSIVTCGIYAYIYYYQMTKDLNQMAGPDDKTVEPGMVVLLSIVTCGIYTWFWYYQMGNRMQNMGNANNVLVEENGTTYLLWILLGSLLAGIGSFIAMYLFIKNFNRLADAYNAGMGVQYQ